MPLPVGVVDVVVGINDVGLIVAVEALLMTPTHTLTSAHMPEQSLRTVGFHFVKSAKVIFWKLITWPHVTSLAIQ